MRVDLVVYHLEKGPGILASPFLTNSAVCVWETCLRRIYIAWGEPNQLLPLALSPAGDGAVKQELFQGADAYRFLLEVVCGLRSPIVGETEVFGQFRAFVQAESFRQAACGRDLQDLARALYEDTKRIREAHLKGIGQISYGSVARRLLKNAARVHILGGGQLAQEVVTWTSPSKEIFVYARKPAKVEAWLAARGKVLPWQNFSSSGIEKDAALVIAAPLGEEELTKLIPPHSPAAGIVLDFREAAECMRLPPANQIFTLQDVFQEFSERKKNLAARMAQAQQSIRERSWRRWDGRLETRPFGWEDVCA